MANKDEFHKRLEKITAQTGTKNVQRVAPTGSKGKKIGLVREKDDSERGPTAGAIFFRLLFLLVVGLFVTRMSLAFFGNVSEDVLEARVDQLMEEPDAGSKAGGVLLMVLGAADPFLSNIFDRVVTEDEAQATLAEIRVATQPSSDREAAEALAVEPVGVGAPTAVLEGEPTENEYSLWAIARRIFDMRSDRPVVPIEQLVPTRIDGWYQMTDADLAVEGQDLASIVTGNGGALPASATEVPLYDFFAGLSEASSEISGMVQLPVTLFFNDQGQAFITTVFVVTTGILTSEDFAAAMAEQNAEFAQSAQSQILVSTATEQTHGFYSDEAFQADQSGTFRGMVGPHFTYVFYSEGMTISDLESALSGFPFDEVASKRF
ncbi:MAG: hypothetical protein AAF198_14090 [Pseudomonadota bacterium]